jgi:hypothetical protein
MKMIATKACPLARHLKIEPGSLRSAIGMKEGCEFPTKYNLKLTNI